MKLVRGISIVLLTGIVFMFLGCTGADSEYEEKKMNGKGDRGAMEMNTWPIADGTFIQWHLVKDWDDAKWQKEFEYLIEAKMQYLVFAPTVLSKVGEISQAVYPTKLENMEMSKEFGDLVDICLRNAEKAGIKVFLGLNFDDHWWKKTEKDEEWFYQRMREGNAIADELYELYAEKYPNAFYGWYWVWEVDNISFRGPKREEILINGLNIQLEHLNAMPKRLPFMLCPFMNHRLGDKEEYKNLWIKVFANTKFQPGDIFCPQDCIGAGGLNLDVFVEWFAALREAVDTKPGLLFWSDAETFIQEDWTSATIDRIVKQFKGVQPYVDNIITFAYSHYYSPNNIHYGFHKAYLEYVETGKLDTTPCADPINIRSTQLPNGSILLNWDMPEFEKELCGFYIYRDGELIEKSQVKRRDTGALNLNPPMYFVDDAVKPGKTYRYLVKAYDFAGNLSEEGSEIIVKVEKGN